MLRHVLILARDQSASAVAVTIALDRHLSRGEYVEIVQDRRGEPPAERWPVRQERRRPGPLADQLLAQGYAIMSREDETHVPAYQAAVPRPVTAPPPPPPAPPPPPRVPLPPPPVSPPPPARPPAPEPMVPLPTAPAAGPRIFERSVAVRSGAERSSAERNFARAPVAPDRRPRLSLDDRQALRESLNEDWSADPDGRTGLERPRRRGGVVAVLFMVAVLAVGLVMFSTHARDRLVNALIPVSEQPETTAPASSATPTDPATRADSATEEPARVASGAADRSAPAPAPLAFSAGGLPSARPGGAPAPSATASTTPSAAPSPTAAGPPPATPETAPAESAAPAPESPRSLPPRRAEASAPERAAEPAPPTVRSQRLPEFPGLPRVEVSRAASADITTFTVKLTDPRGRPLPDAQVWLRQKGTDGFVRETPLEPVSPAGSYRGAVPGGGQRADALTVRVVLGDRRMEMPVSD